MTNSTTTTHLKSLIHDGSHDAIKHWLKISGIHPHTATNVADFYALLQKHIGDGRVRISQLRSVALELEEYGGKRVYLGKLTNYKTIDLRQRFENHLKGLGLRLSPEPVEAKRLPPKPHRNYICWSPKEVRIGYSETHEFMKENRTEMTLEYERITNLVTISVEPATGSIKIMMDAPGDRHPHQRARRDDLTEGYVGFYKREALEILGASEFRPLDLQKAADRIAKSATKIFEETDALERTARNTKQRTWSRSEFRDDPAYAAGAKVDGDKRVVESLSGYWLPGGSA
jgi:hypothetical protein